jgi:ankyrin repeat protein
VLCASGSVALVDTDRGALIDAVKSGDAGAVAALVGRRPELASERDENGLSLVLLALFHRQREACDALLAADPELGVLEAAALGREARLRELLAADQDALAARTPEGYDPIGLAAFLGGAGAVRALLEAGADPNGDPGNPMGVRPVHAAAAAGDRESMAALLAAGADPNARQHGGYTPLHEAAHTDDAELAALLLAGGADPALRTDDGLDAAAIAARDGGTSVAALLVEPAQPS